MGFDKHTTYEEIKRIREELTKRKGRAEQIQHNIKLTRQRMRKAGLQLKASQNALGVIQYVAEKTQSEIKTNLSDIVSASQSAVFVKDPYGFEVEFVPRRDKIEVDMFFERKGHYLDPSFSSGFGARDIAGLSLLFTTHALRMRNNKNVCNTLFLDEPLVWLKGNDYPKRGAEMLYRLSHEMGIQIVMTNHVPSLTKAADRVFDITIENGKTRVQTIERED